MKKMYAFLAVTIFALNGVQAQEQQNSEDHKVKINVKITENGETREINREVTSDTDVNVDSILRELGVMDDMNLSKKGQKIEVNIKKKGHPGEDRDVNVDVYAPHHGFDFDFDEMEYAESKPFLGVYIENVSHEKASELGLKEAGGAFVKEVIEETASEKAGVQAGEVITQFNGTKVESHEHLIDLVRASQPGEQVDVQLYKDGHFRTVTVEIGKKKIEKHFRMHAPFGHFEGEFDEEEFERYFEEHMDNLERKMEHLEEEMEWMDENGDVIIKKFHRPAPGMHGNLKDKAFLGIVPEMENDIEGVQIGKVVEGSAAEEMGMQEGDIITELNGKGIESFEDLVDELDEMKRGNAVEVEVLREGKEHELNGTLKSRAEAKPMKHMFRHRKGAPVIEKEVNVVIEIQDLTEEEAAELSGNAGVDVKVDSDLDIRSLQFAPNPSRGQFNLSFELAEKGDTEIRVFDSNGRQVFYEMRKNLSAPYSNTIDISDEPNGIYFLIVTQGQSQFSKKIVKQ